MEDSQIIDLFFARSEEAIQTLSEKYGAVCRRQRRRAGGGRPPQTSARGGFVSKLLNLKKFCEEVLTAASFGVE